MASSLPYTLSVEQVELFKSLQDSALLPELAEPGSGEIAALYKQRQKDKQKKIIAPYADIFYNESLKQFEGRKESILQQLRESKGIHFTAELAVWKTVIYHESLSKLKAREAAMSPSERSEHLRAKQLENEQIQAKGWESVFGVLEDGWNGWAEETVTIYEPMKLERIFKNSDLAMRLSLLLGPNFFPSYRLDYLDSVGTHERSGFSVYNKILCVEYFPFGLPKDKMVKLLDVAKEQKRRSENGEKIRLGAGEYAAGV